MEIEFSISQARHFSGLDFIARYRASVQLSPGRGVAEIDVVSTIPSEVDQSDLATAIEHIRSGAETVLRRYGMDGRIAVSDLVIHDVDFSPQMYERFTAEELDSAITRNISAPNTD